MRTFNFSRPKKAVSFKEVEFIFVTSGKDIVRLAWESLNPDDDNYIIDYNLSKWFESFFNIYSGYEAINFLHDMGLLRHWWDGVFNRKDYYGPTFEL